ncbi:cadherin-like beta sandwich domain-containing protein [Hyphomicrobium sp.]|uniref:cadherin-like beta sandwich domain-containing protein n=1 Tax=Hyphomicrobium sp. TaxID=82 RepID=UPI003F6ECCBE
MAAPTLAYASPGCNALIGTRGPSFAVTGSQSGTGFTAGDVVTVTFVAGVGSVTLYDSGTFAALTGMLSAPGSQTYTVPSDTTASFFVGGSTLGSTEVSWSCASVVSSNADLSGLVLSPDTLSPAFSSGTTSYTASVTSGTSSITVTPTNDDTNATTTVNGTPVVSGNASGSIPLNIGDNTITVVVTAEDGTTTKTYSVTVTRDASSIADLSNLSLSQGSLSPTFSASTTAYTASVASSVTSITVAATLVEPNATITVNGNLVTSGNPSGAIALNAGDNTITVVVTAQDGTTTKTFTVTVNRALSANADLSSLSLSQGSLSPAFRSGTTSYTASVANSVTSFTIKPMVDDAGATVTVNGSSVASGSPSGPISLNVGANTIPIVVTASDHTTTKTYSIVITRAGTSTISFTPASGLLKHAMAGEDYTAGITTTANAANTPIFTISSGALPPGMILNVSTGELSGPLAANALGLYTFTISVTDSANGGGSVTYALLVVPTAVTVADKVQTVPVGSPPPNVYLNRDATGGPFTSAQLASVQPANAGTATIIQGELAQAGPPAGPFGYYLKFTPAPGYTGTVKIGYKLISALGTSNTGTVSYMIAANAAAVASDVDRDVKSFVQARQNLLSSTVKTPGLVERRRMTKAADGLSTRATPNGDGVKLGVSTSLAELRAASSGGKAGAQPANIWVDGTLLAHRRDDTNGEWGSFGMLSAGADYLLSPSLLVGVSLHLDRMTDPTSAGTELSGNGWLAGPYVSLEIGRGVFFDTSLLYGGSSNDIDTAFFDGSFETARWMWSGEVSGQWSIDDGTTVTPRLRALYLNEQADGYDVADGIGGVILLDGFTQEQLRFSVGADVERQVLLENGLVLTPSLGITAGVASLDNSGLFGSLSTGLRLSDGMSWDVEGALLFSLEGDGEIATGGKLGGSVRF